MQLMLYTDPGSGALLWQIIAAGAVGAMFYVRKVLSFFARTPKIKGSEYQKVD
jgi:hypothetical protein